MKLENKNNSILEFNMRLLKMIMDNETPLFEKYNFACIVYDNLNEFITVRLYRADIEERQKLIKKISFMYAILSKFINEFIYKFKGDDLYLDSFSPYQNYLESNLEIIENIEIEDDKSYYVFIDSQDCVKFIESKRRVVSVNNKYVLEEILLEKYLIENFNIKEFGIFKLIRRQNYFIDPEIKDMNTALNEIKLLVNQKNNNRWELMQTNITSEQFLEKIKTKANIGYDIDIMNVNSYIFNIKDYKNILKDKLDRKDHYKKLESKYSLINFKRELDRGDMLFYTPYHSYKYITDFIDQMCTSKDIKSIYQTMYRLSDESAIVDS